MTDVTVFFRDTSKWRSPDHRYTKSELYSNKMFSAEIISDKDSEKLNELAMCIYRIQQKSKEKREKYFDNYAILKFIDELVLMIDDISRKKNIKNYIAHRPGPTLEISVPVEYD